MARGLKRIMAKAGAGAGWVWLAGCWPGSAGRRRGGPAPAGTWRAAAALAAPALRLRSLRPTLPSLPASLLPCFPDPPARPPACLLQVPVLGWGYVRACNREDKAAGGC